MPFKQKCYEVMSQQELSSLIRSMLNTCHLQENKQKHLQLYSKTVEEVQGDIINQWVKQTGVGQFQKEKTLELRIRLSKEANRVRFFGKNHNILASTSVCQYMEADYVASSMEAAKKCGYDRSFKGIQKAFRRFSYKVRRNVKRGKKVDAW